MYRTQLQSQNKLEQRIRLSYLILTARAVSETIPLSSVTLVLTIWCHCIFGKSRIHPCVVQLA
jgi:hypothetical protein